MTLDCSDFYNERDDRTVGYVRRPWCPERVVRLVLDEASARTEVGQHLLLSLTNLLARAHRHIVFTLPDAPIALRTFSPCSGNTLQEATTNLASAVDPCGVFELGDKGGDIQFGIGPEAEVGLDWYLGADRAIGYLQQGPAVLSTGFRGSLLGAGVAACLGAAAAFKAELGLPVVGRKLSSWNYLEDVAAERGPDTVTPLDVGRVLVVGAGAVASGLVYWLRAWGVAGEWTVVDRDTVKLHNTNRSILFLPSDAGWPSGEEQWKADVLAGFLPHAQSVRGWLHEAEDVRDRRFDVVLALANEFGVREQLAHRNATVMLHATTGQNWLSQLHRHVAGRDDCVDCRLGDVKEVAFECSTAEVASSAGGRRDEALPFLSAASGLMLAGLLQRLQAGVLTETDANNWRWDFRSSHLMAAPPGRSKCRTGCCSWYPAPVRTQANAGTAWSHLDAS